ncbi:MAG TPA: FAD-dependent oxidoreductase [Candidatus Gastranaerophilales bacterium]|nr:FAD-dependent oxidoreductase [Candidatus Gastranaerophilales bacterium]
MQEHLIIIGGVAAGTKAASKARRENSDLKISLYTDEKYVSYSACGMPYYIQGLIPTEQKLLVRSPEAFKTKENIDIYLLHKVIKIIPDENKVLVKNQQTQEEFEDKYTNLLIATGSSSFIPPIEGTDLKNVFKLKSIEDAIKIKEAVKSAKKAVIIGAGYIGLELAEAFHELGLQTTIIERLSQILGVFDLDLAFQIQTYMEKEKKIKIILNDSVISLKGDNKGSISSIATQNGEIIDADIAIIAVGVKPNVEIAKNAGIELGETGAIKVDSRMQTNFSNIYAAGDCAESINRITGKPVWIPLGSTANKHGRVAAINITGGYAEFKGILGSMVVKIFEYTASKTGLSEKEAKNLGIDYEIAIVSHKDKSGYMPDAEEITLKVIAEKNTGKLLGIQAIGKGDADKRVNVVAAAITAGMTVENLSEIDLTYAPPYSSAIDTLLVAAQILEDKIKKDVTGISPQNLQKFLEEKKPCCVIDIRSPEEFEAWHLKQAKNISMEELEAKIEEEKPESMLVCCDEGMTGYLQAMKLKEKGCKNVSFIDGGINYLKKLPEYNK